MLFLLLLRYFLQCVLLLPICMCFIFSYVGMVVRDAQSVAPAVTIMLCTLKIERWRFIYYSLLYAMFLHVKS
jgi:hypothetical protein